MVSLFSSGLIFYCNSIIQNVYVILFLTKNLASPETFAYRYLALRVRSAEVKKTKGVQVIICFLCGDLEEV